MIKQPAIRHNVRIWAPGLQARRNVGEDLVRPCQPQRWRRTRSSALALRTARTVCSVHCGVPARSTVRMAGATSTRTRRASGDGTGPHPAASPCAATTCSSVVRYWQPSAPCARGYGSACVHACVPGGATTHHWRSAYWPRARLRLSQRVQPTRDAILLPTQASLQLLCAGDGHVAQAP